MSDPHRTRRGRWLAWLASVALLLGLVPAGAAQATGDSGGPADEGAASSTELVLEFGEPDPDPEHPAPEDQRVLEDPAGWPWWAWVGLTLALVAIGVPVALLLMKKAGRAMSRSDTDQ